jgi:hypothetical protein
LLPGSLHLTRDRHLARPDSAVEIPRHQQKSPA